MKYKSLSKSYWFIPFIVIVLLWTSAFGGGKAEPLRIQFKHGATSTTVKGRLRGGEQTEYGFTARQGQRVTLRLVSTPTRSTTCRLLATDGTEVALSWDKRREWSGVLPATGEYVIAVAKTTAPRPGASIYVLTVTIR
jgi:hypothetical protein